MPKVKFGRWEDEEILMPEAEGTAEIETVEPVYAQSVYADLPPAFIKVNEIDGVLQFAYEGYKILNIGATGYGSEDFFDKSLIGKLGHYRITVEFWPREEQ